MPQKTWGRGDRDRLYSRKLLEIGFMEILDGCKGKE